MGAMIVVKADDMRAYIEDRRRVCKVLKAREHGKLGGQYPGCYGKA